MVYSGVFDREIHIQFDFSTIFRISSEKFRNNTKITNRETTEH